ncbi:hypothetical protein ACFC34_22900, partial [Streptomyces sp. NPDC056053]
AVKEIQTEAGDLKATILEKLTSYLIPTVIIAGITWIISLLNPASAFIRAVKGIIDIVTFIVNQGAQIVEFVNAVLDSVIAIANGGSAGVPKMVETALAASVPLLIGFLASLLGIGNLANKVKSVFHTVAKPVNRAIDKIVDLITKKGKALWNKIKKKDDPGPGKGTSPQNDKTSKERSAIRDANRLLNQRHPKETVTEKLPAISSRHRVPLHLVVESKDSHGERVHVQTMSSNAVTLPPERDPRLLKLDELITKQKTDEICKIATEGAVIAVIDTVSAYGVKALASGLSGAETGDLIGKLDLSIMPNLVKGRRATEGSWLKKAVDRFGASAVNELGKSLGGRKIAELVDMNIFETKHFDQSKHPAITPPRGNVARSLPPLENRLLADIEADLVSAGMNGPLVERGQHMWTHPDGSVVRIKVGREALQGVRKIPHAVREISENPGSYNKDDIVAKVTDNGNLVATGTNSGDNRLFSWFHEYTKRDPNVTEKGILTQIWADAGHTNIRL